MQFWKIISRQEKTASYNNNRPYIENKKEFSLSNQKAYFLTGRDFNKILQDFQSKEVDACGIFQDVLPKGQLISEWNFGVFKSPEKPSKF